MENHADAVDWLLIIHSSLVDNNQLVMIDFGDVLIGTRLNTYRVYLTSTKTAQQRHEQY